MGRTWTNKQRHDKSYKEHAKKFRDIKRSKRHTYEENIKTTISNKSKLDEE